MSFAEPFTRERGLLNPIFTLLFVGAVLLLLKGGFEAIRSMRTRALAQQYPHEPWRWDHSWRRELDD